MYNCISLYVICLYWRIYVCMYHLEYMYIVSAYKYILAYGSNLLAYMAHAVAKPCKNLFHRLKKTGITFIFGVG
jgi:hypothetical protein